MRRKKNTPRPFFVIRFGPEEFCVYRGAGAPLAVCTSPAAANAALRLLRGSE